LGGDSIMSLQVVSRARRAGIAVTARDLFTHRTVAALAAAARTLGDAPEVTDDGTGLVPLTPLATATIRDGFYDNYCQATVVHTPVGADRAALATALADVIAHHDILRARLVDADGDGAPDALDVPRETTLDLDALVREVAPGTDRDAQVRAELTSAAARLDPAAGVMVQAVFLSPVAPEERGALLIAAHHLVVDGVSWRVLLEDLAARWNREGLDPVPTSVRTWNTALADRASAGDTEARARSFAARIGDFEQPLGIRDFDPALDTHASTADVTVELDVATTRALLSTVPRVYAGSVDDGLYAALAVAVVRWHRGRGTATDSVLVARETHGRADELVDGADLSRTVGWFTAAYPVRLDLSGIVTDADGFDADAIVRSVKEQLRAGAVDGIDHGLARYLDPAGEELLAGCARPQIGFNYLGRFAATGAGGAQDWSALPGFEGLLGHTRPEMPAATAVDVNAVTVDGPDGPRLQARLTYATGILDEEQARALGAAWADAAATLARHAETVPTVRHTPGDFLDTGASQADVCRWERQFGELADVLPMTGLQQGLIFESQLHADSDAVDVYAGQVAFEFTGPLDRDRLQRAAQALLDAHPNLRAAFVTDENGAYRSVVPAFVPMPWMVVDVTADEDPDAAADRVADAERDARFDPAVPPLLRCALVVLAPERHRLIVTEHHAVIDGWSTPLLVAELIENYRGGTCSDTAGERDGYRNFLTWLAEQEPEATRDAWGQVLAPVDGPTLVAPAERVSVAEFPQIAPVTLDAVTSAGVVAAARACGVTVSTVAQVAWAMALAQQTGQSTVVFGATVSGRPSQVDGVESAIGLFINTIPVVVELDPSDRLEDVLVRVQEQQVSVLDHHHVSLTELHRIAGQQRLFDTLVVFESYPMDESALTALLDDDALSLAGLSGRDSTQYPMTLEVTPGDEIAVEVAYLPTLVDEVVAVRAAEAVRAVLAQCAVDVGV
ncbi:condensation domain-containing protein, partial [Rhodococcus phenolicus]|uniref:condensation domain-containing protein n=1 Tax=Rhodococcus phenolicus TaxID=263849 RepID=UPI001FE1F7D2